jgi:hypoxia up-regulated 1
MGIVVTVPPYFNQAQRKAVLLVGQIAKIKIMQLLNANTAVGINYGVFRAKTFNKTATNILFYDMGATSTVATVAS